MNDVVNPQTPNGRHRGTDLNTRLPGLSTREWWRHTAMVAAIGSACIYPD